MVWFLYSCPSWKVKKILQSLFIYVLVCPHLLQGLSIAKGAASFESVCTDALPLIWPDRGHAYSNRRCLHRQFQHPRRAHGGWTVRRGSAGSVRCGAVGKEPSFGTNRHAPSEAVAQGAPAPFSLCFYRLLKVQQQLSLWERTSGGRSALPHFWFNSLWEIGALITCLTHPFLPRAEGGVCFMF